MMCTIKALPPELILEIFSYLSLEDLLDVVPHVCTTWRDLVRHPSLWEDFVYCEENGSDVIDAVKFVERCPMLKHIHASYHEVSPEEGGELVSAVISNCDDMRSFCVDLGRSSLELPQVNALFEAFPNLESFHITVTSQNAAVIVDRISACSKLKKLTVEFQYYHDGLLIPIVDGCTSLDSLHIDATCIRSHSVKEIPEDDFLYLLENMKDKLLCLQLSYRQQVTQDIIDLLGCFTKLQNLTLRHYCKEQEDVDFTPLTDIETLKCFSFVSHTFNWNVLHTLFDALFEYPFPLLERLSIDIVFVEFRRTLVEDICLCYPNLKSLYLFYALRENVKEIFSEIGRLNQLESFSFFKSETMTDKDTEYIAQCPRLKHLVLRNCRGLTDKAINNLASCKSLELLNLAGCSISGENFHLIPKHFEQLKELIVNSVRVHILDALAEQMPSLKINLLASRTHSLSHLDQYLLLRM